MDEEWGASDLFGSTGPDDQQWNTPNQQYDIGDSSTLTSMGQYDNYGSNYQVSSQPDMSWQSNISNSPMDGWQQSGTNWGNIDQQLGSTFNSPAQQAYDMGQGAMGGTSQVLANLFNGGAGSKGMLTGLGAIVEGMANKKKQQSSNQLAQTMQPAIDPFGSQRGFYQQQLQQAIQDPYSSPIVRNQVEQLTNAQRIADAKAGRRSNQAGSNPALLAAQAQVAQKYMDSLQQPAGANISPNGLSNILALQQQGNTAAINGYASPMLAALSKQSTSMSNSNEMQKILDALAQFKSGG